MAQRFRAAICRISAKTALLVGSRAECVAILIRLEMVQCMKIAFACREKENFNLHQALYFVVCLSKGLKKMQLPTINKVVLWYGNNEWSFMSFGL